MKANEDLPERNETTGCLIFNYSFYIKLGSRHPTQNIRNWLENHQMHDVNNCQEQSIIGILADRFRLSEVCAYLSPNTTAAF